MLLQDVTASTTLVTTIAELVKPWQEFYSEHTAVSTAVLFLHLAALVASGGLAFANDRAIVAAPAADGDERLRRLADLSQSHRSVITALVLTFVSGAMLLFADFEAFMGMPAYWVKMLLITALFANALLMRRREAILRLNAAGPFGTDSPQFGKLWTGLRRHAFTSLTLWFAIVLAGTAMTAS